MEEGGIRGLALFFSGGRHNILCMGDVVLSASSSPVTSRVGQRDGFLG
jgi:hypothetical protein